MCLEEETVETWRDEIVEEVRRVRDAHAARFDYDLRAIVADLKKREQEGPYKVVSLPVRRRHCVDKTTS